MKKLVLVPGIILGVLLLLELVLRVCGLPAIGRPLGEFHSRLGWALAPGKNYQLTGLPAGAEASVSLAANGARVGKSGTGKNILVLGGANAMGFGTTWSETFAARLAARLEKRGLPVKPMAGGGDGYSLDQMLVWFKEKGASLRPDLVILVLDQLATQRLLSPTWRGRAKPVFALGQGVNQGPMNLPLAPLHQPALAILSLFSSPPAPAGMACGNGRIAAEYAVLARKEPKAVGVAWQTAKYLLGQIKAEVRAVGALLMAIPCPAPFQLSGEETHRLVKEWGVKMDDIYIDLPREKLLRICQDHGIEWVPTLIQFRETAKRGQEHFLPGSRLLSPVGHQVLASLIEYHLMALGWNGLVGR